MSDALLRFENVTKSYGDFTVFSDISLEVHEKEVVSIIGSSGSGKTTLLRCINLLEPFEAGKIILDGQEIGYHDVNGKRKRVPEKVIAQQRSMTGMVFQQFNLFPHMTAKKNVMLGLTHTKKMPKAEAETMRGSIPLPEIAALCRAHGLPIIVDAAAELPPKANIRKYLDDGASLVVFSGGKEIRGPQASGMILGSRELIAACELNCCPNYGIGRPMKVDKENICGLVKAVELFVQRDYDQIMAQWDSYVDTIRAGLSDCPGLEMTIGIPTEPGVQPACIRRLFLRPLTMPAAALRQALIDGEPSIYTFLYQDQIVINPQCLQAHELSPIVQAIRGILMQHR